eukprot:scpid40131/ scgid17221/ R3H domain-containing protein 1
MFTPLVLNMIKAPLAPVQQSSSTSPVIMTSGSRVTPASPHDPVCQSVEKCPSTPSSQLENNCTPAVSSKPAMSMSKVRVLRREDSTGQVSPSGNTSISDGPRPTPEAVGAQPAAAMSSPRSSLDDSAKIKQSSPTGNASVSVLPPLPMTDAANPSLDLRQFLIDTLNQAKDRLFLLQTEQSILGHLTSKQHMAPLKISTATSYHRMLVHRVAAFFGMDHLTNHSEPGVILQKTAKTRLPAERFKELIQMKSGSGEGDDSTASAAPTVGISPRVILKRQDAPNASVGAGSGSSSPTANQSNQNGDERRPKTIEEREAEYEEHRKRIFSQHPAISTAGESSTGSTAVTTSSGCRATSSANFAARAPNTVVRASVPTSAPRNNSDQVVDALVDMDYDRSLPLTSSDTSLAGVLGAVASGSANSGKAPGMRSQGLGEALPVASSVAISGLPGGDNVWKAAGPGVLQTADNGIAASSVTPTNLVRPSLSDGSSLEYVRHRFDKHAISERCGGAVRHQGQMSSRGGGGLAASANASGKPHSLLSLPHQGHQQQRWQAGSSSNNAAVGGPRGLMPLPGHAGLTSSYSAPQQFVPSMASGHSGVAAATYANPGAMGNGGYATPVGMASPTPSHNSGRAGLNATSHSNTGGKDHYQRGGGKSNRRGQNRSNNSAGGGSSNMSNSSNAGTAGDYHRAVSQASLSASTPSAGQATAAARFQPGGNSLANAAASAGGPLVGAAASNLAMVTPGTPTYMQYQGGLGGAGASDFTGNQYYMADAAATSNAA